MCQKMKNSWISIRKKKCNFRKNNPGLEMVLHGESIQVANKHMKRCSNSAGK